MNRRKFLAGLGATAVGGAAATGTGAFTSVEADRTVSVAVADESTGSYLVLDALAESSSENGAFATNPGSDGKLVFDFNAEIDDTTNSEGGEGPGKNSVYEFDEVFEVENQGSQTVNVGIETLTQSDFEDGGGSSPTDTLEMSFYPNSDATSPLQGSPVSISPGSAQTVGVKIDIGDVNFSDFSAEATVIADADSGQISF
ncbi:DUF1102 domain-containing protein [Halorubrum distributum]|uniref:DUF1102 domain-containing protein n=1 Tax=Halorubrum distributum JCM 13916 TaxID=1230455 RepID=M0PJ54_9EURY|nr:DUF1102 domain-containing protein [Halorubrum arcis]EMA69649.1 hypothetical protein C462_12275 [Halorubrum arcis JCM 13916]